MMNCLKEISRDNARTPMQWNTKENAGFTTGTPWIKVNKNYLEINAEAEMAEKDSVYNYYKKLIRLRKENEIMVHGRFNPLLEEDDHIYAYERLWEGEKIVVACNFTKEVQACDLFRGLEDGKELISNYKEHKTGVLQPYEAIAVLCKA